jgi:hypothetical protein
MLALPDMSMRAPALFVRSTRRIVQITRPLALAFLLFTGACASTPGQRGSQEAAKKPLMGGIAEFRVASYDGVNLVGRVLLGATAEPLVIDGRLVAFGNVELKNLRACGKKDRLLHYVFDVVLPPARPDQIITIRPGYWYGRKVNFGLFDEKETGIGPECIEGELMVLARGARVAATLPIRVVRTDKPPAPPDGGTGEPKPPPSDAGAP